MKKLLSLFVLASLLLVIGFASATEPACSSERTLISGVVYIGEDMSNVVPGANVLVICYHGDEENTLPAVLTDENGLYSVSFKSEECDYLDIITVIADKGDLEGENTGQVTNEYSFSCMKLNAGNVNVPLVPEFGTIVGIVTALGALGVFFIVRQR